MRSATAVSRRPRYAAALALALVALGGGCSAKLLSPILHVERLAVEKVRITSLGLEVGFRVRNPNPESITIERFEYELSVNGKHLGRGFGSQSVSVPGFDERSMTSRFDLNYLSLPAGVKAILDGSTAHVEVDGRFYLGGGQKVSLSANADLPIGRGERP